ncbi:tautomerase family protein [Nocardia farcinica]|uniref:tautomerase family protein n=1 Tax=Nocardia farcinica TaxID=37329 RepID=UPI0018945CD9|nr:tautomerase family protein [Nocardia farcinica]MBF6140285.1 tautomerase family protein [Nocardia farcinica]MBF6387323.1 tautomerase family protein [Nocardia farcinica]
MRPLWHIYHPPATYTEADKQEFAQAVTRSYRSWGLPDFDVVVLFHEIAAADCFVGGRPADSTVRVVVEHLARQLEDPDMRRIMTEKLDTVMAPFTHDRGLHCEFHVDETPRDLWMIGGLHPPPAGSAAEKQWVAAGKPVPYH